MISEATRLRLRALAKAAPPGPYQVQMSNSFRRIGTRHGDGDVLCAVTQRSDGHPDLHAAPGVLDLFAALDPATVLELLDFIDLHAVDEEYCDELEKRLERLKP